MTIMGKQMGNLHREMETVFQKEEEGKREGEGEENGNSGADKYDI